MNILIKYFLIASSAIAVVVLALFVITIPIVNSLSDCLSDYNSRIRSNILMAQQEKWNKETMCQEGKSALLELSSCYSFVDTQSFLSVDTVFQVAKIIRLGSIGGSVNEAIEIHNFSCADYPETQIR